jgi:catalase
MHQHYSQSSELAIAMARTLSLSLCYGSSMQNESEMLVDEVSAQYGSAHRAVHAVGMGMSGFFTPARDAAEVSSAAIFSGRPVRVTARYSNSVGFPVLPQIPPDDKQADVRGMAVKYHLDGDDSPDGSMDMISMTLDRFFNTVADFQGFLRHVAPNPATGVPDVDAITLWGHEHPSAGGVLQAYKQVQKFHELSYASISYHGVHTFIYVNEKGHETPARFSWMPDDPQEPVPKLPKDTRADYLRRDLASRVRSGQGVGFNLVLAHPGVKDNPNILSTPWESKDASGKKIPDTIMGHLQLGALVADQYWDCEALAFNPTRLIDGVQPNPEDQILAARKGAYVEGHGRRTAVYPRPSS